MWTIEEDCKEVIANAWNSEVVEDSPMFQVVEKLKGCRGSLIAWSKVKFGFLASIIKHKKVQLQNLLIAFPGNESPDIRLLQDELNGLLEKDNILGWLG